jgi:ATP-dependent Clp protease ATP-binding subunit ClpC
MFERFTERARQVVVLAQDEARANEQAYIGTEHLLLGLLREEEGLAARVLASFDVTIEEARVSVERRATGAREKVEGQIPFTPRAKKSLELSLREALSLGHNYIGTEHLLLGLLREGENLAVEILHGDFKATAEAIRNEVIRMLSGPKAPILTKSPESEPAQSGKFYDDESVDALLEAAVELARKYDKVPVDQIVIAAKALT